VPVSGHIRAIRLHLVELRYGERVAPYEWSAGIDHRFPALLVEVASDRATGWGEGGLLWSDPLVREPALLQTWVDAAAACLVDRPVAEFRQLGARLTAGPLPSADDDAGWQRARSGPLTWEPAAVAAESALWDLFAREAAVPLRTLLGDGSRRRIPVAPSIGRFRPEAAAAIAAGLVDDGFSVLKLKGGRGVDLDVTIVECVRATIGPDAALRLDPNGGYDASEAGRLALRLAGAGLEYLEQPCPPMSLRRLGELRRVLGVPMALDESVLGAASIVEIHDAAAADVILVEPHQIGGLGHLLDAVSVAEACGLPVGVHAAYSTGVRTAAILHLAAARAAIRCAPDTLYHDLAEDVLGTRIAFDAGCLALPEGPGLGVEVDPDRVAAMAVASFGGSAAPSGRAT
jgi:glucarate dehydratase